MGRRVKDFIEISEYTSLDQLINALTAIREIFRRIPIRRFE